MACQHLHSTRGEEPVLLMTLALTALVGSAVLIVGTIAAQMIVPNHDWISDTLSDLGAGEWELVMDLSLYGFAAALFAIALGTAHAHLGGVAWSVGTLSFATIAALVVVIGARNEYGDGDSDGVVIHNYLVYGIGALFAIAPLCFGVALSRDHRAARNVLLFLSAVWVLCSPVFLWAPTGIDGLIERLLGLVACAMTVTLSAVLLRRARRG